MSTWAGWGNYPFGDYLTDDPVLAIPPDQSGYKAKYGKTVVSAQLDGGAGRYRADQLGASFTVDVKWTVNLTNFNYLSAFYRRAVAFGSLPFTIALMIDNGSMNNYQAYFVPDTFQLASQTGLQYVISATIEVMPNAAYAGDDDTILAAGPDV